MRRDVDVLTYFNEYAAFVGSKKGMNRTLNALIIARIHSMEQLCGMTYEELMKVRNIGKGGVELIARIRWQYLYEQNL